MKKEEFYNPGTEWQTVLTLISGNIMLNFGLDKNSTSPLKHLKITNKNNLLFSK